MEHIMELPVFSKQHIFTKETCEDFETPGHAGSSTPKPSLAFSNDYQKLHGNSTASNLHPGINDNFSDNFGNFRSRKIWSNGVGRFADEGNWGDGLWLGLGKDADKMRQQQRVDTYYADLKKQIEENKQRKQVDILLKSKEDWQAGQRIKFDLHPHLENWIRSSSQDASEVNVKPLEHGFHKDSTQVSRMACEQTDLNCESDCESTPTNTETPVGTSSLAPAVMKATPLATVANVKQSHSKRTWDVPRSHASRCKAVSVAARDNREENSFASRVNLSPSGTDHKRLLSKFPIKEKPTFNFKSDREGQVPTSEANEIKDLKKEISNLKRYQELQQRQLVRLQKKLSKQNSPYNEACNLAQETTLRRDSSSTQESSNVTGKHVFRVFHSSAKPKTIPNLVMYDETRNHPISSTKQLLLTSTRMIPHHSSGIEKMSANVSKGFK